MAPSIVHLPNGQTLTVTPVFGGLSFRSNELNTHHNVFPPGWTINLHSAEEADEAEEAPQEREDEPIASAHAHTQPHHKKYNLHRFRAPTLHGDQLFISSISNPSSQDFLPASSPTRQIAMMLWATLWWYFHQHAPSPYVKNAASANTPDVGKPRGEWRVQITREGIFQGKHLLPKLERMGLISSEDSSVGVDPEDGVNSMGDAWRHMFVSQRSFWQLDARIYLFTLSPAQINSPFPSLSPSTSRPASPSRSGGTLTPRDDHSYANAATAFAPHIPRSNTPPGPFSSGSHLPTFYPPPPLQYKFTNGIRHPIRPKPPRQGETFYSRYVPSLGQYISFRVASLSPKPVIYRGPVCCNGHNAENSKTYTVPLRTAELPPSPATPTPSGNTTPFDDRDSSTLNDVELLHKWMNNPRVAYAWGESGPMAHQEAFLRAHLSNKHSFPVIGSFDGKPFGYFEIYWAKEDNLAAHVATTQGAGAIDDWDRGLHVLVGEQAFRGPERVKVWLSALVHHCFLADLRTSKVVMEPRVDNEKLKGYCESVGFHKAGEVSFAHKQSNFMKIPRDVFEAPAL
ncbi:n(6)-hydroxylysine o-acetyltransferase [Acrodontium crateriforme]|uniref:N(6)-hydroxylysine o-acetyltransferase n=1 Tax=Acrodontium crateriforme TaxID=150365 RepID=A0AAQ3LZK2_9PEZI|nr:n(6)-hydroxylysine o-acetyltransferase [Acrodontium crateriforme]